MLEWGGGAVEAIGQGGQVAWRGWGEVVGLVNGG